MADAMFSLVSPARVERFFLPFFFFFFLRTTATTLSRAAQLKRTVLCYLNCNPTWHVTRVEARGPRRRRCRFVCNKTPLIIPVSFVLSQQDDP